MTSVTVDSSGSRSGEAMTLAETLRGAARGGTGGLIYIRPGGGELRQSYAELWAEARRIAAGLRAGGVAPGDPVLLQLELAEDFFPAFWGAILAGAVPSPVAVAPTYAQPNGPLQKLLNAAKLLERASVIAAGSTFEGLRALPERLGRLTGEVWAIDALRRHEPLPEKNLPLREPTDTAVLLLTSGSTGQSKAVPLTHRNLLAMAAGTIEANGFSARDVTLNWMALDHVGSVSFLGTMAVKLACTQIHVPTGYILQEPLRWLELISRHRATISWAPNFAFTLFLEREAAVKAGTWDLGSMRFLVNAGEPVVARTARRFITLLQEHGLPRDALRPAFGMSETCSGITWSRGLTLENTRDDEPFVDLGPCIPGAEMRVVNEKNEPLVEGEKGLLQMRGPSVFGGYFRNPTENAQVFRDGWFTTGDLAFLRGGCLHISGRLKDVIIVNGANFYCHEIEEAAEAVPGLMKTFTAASAIREAGAETDQLAVFFCLDDPTPDAVAAAARAIRVRLIRDVGVPPTFLISLRPADIPKTEIGKIQRGQLKKAFEAGAFRDRVVQLARPTAPAARAKAKPTRTRTQLAPAIAEIWQEVLGLESVGYDETFFELGGHSLLVVKVQAQLEKLIGRPVAVVELFNCPTVRTMAEHFAREFGEETAASVAVKDAAHNSQPAADQSRDIAIIGIGLRFPGASSPEEFWRVLAEGRETIQFFSAEESLAAGVDPEIVRQPNHVRAAPMLDAPEGFDAEFFKYSAKEARLIDPQQRVFLEVCWEAFEDAGYDPLTYPGKVALFAAAGMNTYLANNLLANAGYMREENGGRMLTVDSMSGFNVMITNDKDYLPVRVSYKLNLRGPSVNVQSACSSTLLTLHEACNSLRLGDCAMALAGGVSIKLPQHAGHLYSPGMLNSPDGHCRAYDEKAEGTIFGNGAGVVLLKPLAAARADGDRIYAVVKATATNNDGAGKVGFTAPSAAGEEDVCAEALARAGVSAESVTFMEGHGTGTALGDPIEVNALASAFRRQTDRTGYCALGSVKTNVGHLQIASGIAGLIKTTLALHHRQIPGTLHFEKPNPRIDFGRTPFFVNRELRAWESSGGPRRAGVNSLGIGGTNVHAILEEAPPAEAPVETSGPQVLPLSARHPRALRQMARSYAEALAKLPASALGDAAFTAQVGRAALPVRAAFVGETTDDLVTQLRAFAETPETANETVNFDQHGVVFLFSGSTPVDRGEMQSLYRTEPVFAAALDRAVAELEAQQGKACKHWWREPVPVDATPEFAGSLSFCFEYALAELLVSYGIEPAVTAGRGLGEISAAARAGVFTFEDGLRLVAAHDRLLAAVDGAAAEAEFLRIAGEVGFSAPDRRLFSADEGAWVESDVTTAAYWLQRARAAATLSANFTELQEAGFAVVVHLGTRALSEATAGDSLRHLAAASFSHLLATLFALGYPVQWSAGRQVRPGRRVSLPTYPWQHQAYWIEGTDLLAPKPVRSADAEPDPLLGRRFESPRVRECVYETRFDPRVLPELAEHQVHGRIVTPGALYLAQVALQARDFLRVGRSGSDSAVVLNEVVFVSAMVIDPEQPPTVQTVFTPEGAGTYRFEVLSWTEVAPDRVAVHATGKVTTERVASSDGEGPGVALTAGEAQSIERHYAVMDAMAVGLGPSFRWIRDIQTRGDESLLRLEAPEALAGRREWHAGLVDSFLQAAVSAHRLDGAQTLIPFRVERIAFGGRSNGAPLVARARRAPQAGSTEKGAVRTDLWLYDAAGNVQAEVKGFELRALSASDVQPATAATGTPNCFEVMWEPLGAPPALAAKNEAGAWILLSDGGTYGRALRRALEAAGEMVEEVFGFDLSRLENRLRERRWNGVIHAAQVAARDPGEIHWGGLLAAVQASSRAESGPLRWVFVTADPRRQPASSPLAGFATALGQELSEFRPLLVEIDPENDVPEDWIPWVLNADSTESRLARCDGRICGARLVEKAIAGQPFVARSDGAYLVTGGAGALGLAVAEWLVTRGAGEIVLAGRRPASTELKATIAAWALRGARVSYAMADVGEAASVRRLVADAEAHWPLRGVFHAAGALRDGLLRQAEVDAFTSILGPKIDGAWELHQATKDKSLDCFVLFSSIASLLGSPGQANYAAGNAFLDGLARYRQAAGLPALSIQWGPWDEIGMTARLAERDRQRVTERGLLPMAPARAIETMERLLGAASGCVGVWAWDRTKYQASLPSGGFPAFYRRLFSDARPAAAAEPVDADAKSDLAALPESQRVAAIEQLISKSVASILGLASPLDVDREKGLFDIGIDSLTAIDLKLRLEKALGQSLRTTIAFDYPTTAAMAAHLAVALFPAASVKPAPAVAPRMPEPAALPDDFNHLTTSDLEALLEKELKD